MESRSFSQGVKNELAHAMPPRDCCRRALLASMLLGGGTLAGLGPTRECSVETTNVALVRLLLQLVRQFEGPTVRWETRQGGLKNTATRYVVRLACDVAERRTHRFLSRIGLGGGSQIPPPLPSLTMERRAHTGEEGCRFGVSEYSAARRRCCRRAFAQGAFLIGGSVEHPHRAYHLEWTVRDPALAPLLTQTLGELELPVKTLARRYHVALYLKSADLVARALTTMGATQALLELEEIRAVKETKNLVHRRVNCETANLARLSGAAVEQVTLLRSLEENGTLRRLPPDLRTLARARLRSPFASYTELGKALKPPLAKASISRKLQRLLQITRTLLP